MSSERFKQNSNGEQNFISLPARQGDRGLNIVSRRLARNLKRDALVQQTVDWLREGLAVDRVVLYYFYCQWEGQVTFESLSADEFSIYGSTGPDQCFNDEYAALYLAGRTRAIADIETEAIAECHRKFLREMQVRANLVVPVLTPKGLWGLLIAHHCQEPRTWKVEDFDVMTKGAVTLANAPSIHDS